MKAARSILPSLFPILDIKQGRENRDEGMSRAEKKANKDVSDFSKKAMGFLVEFLKTHSDPFMAEDLRSYFAQMDYELPENSRAFGGLFFRARKEGLIKKVGLGNVKNIRAHRCYASVWQKVKV
jgi:hypothetical protein